MKPKAKGKEKASDKKTIPIPVGSPNSDDSELSAQDLDFFEEYGGSAAFLSSLDQSGISRCVLNMLVVNMINPSD